VRTIGVVTVARSDYGIYLPVLRAIQAERALHLHLIAAAAHLDPRFGDGIAAIEADGFEIGDRVEMTVDSDTPLGTARSIGRGVAGFAESYARTRPDILLALGDRFEMHAAVLAALPLGIPVAHIHGGEVTEGAIDDALRHGITKIAHLHFAATQQYADRIVRMGEEPWRVCVSGAPSLDGIATMELLSDAELASRFGVRLDPAPILVTFHPATRGLDRTRAQVDALLNALEGVDRPILFTQSNADPNARMIDERVAAFAASRANARVADNLGRLGYFSVLKRAAAMLGNSSSGIIEAPSFELPVVNVGNRQDGRTRAANVIDVERDEDPTAIRDALERALDPAFRASLSGAANPYATGHAAETIVTRLRDVPIDARLLTKRFYDAPNA
jgi:UDP-hydrolysing UDP-N-acetyl-D-glucosamine 2-epimerase